jgi:hypothetical protein
MFRLNLLVATQRQDANETAKLTEFHDFGRVLRAAFVYMSKLVLSSCILILDNNYKTCIVNLIPFLESLLFPSHSLHVV